MPNGRTIEVEMTSNGLSTVPEGADELDSSLHFELDDLEGTGLVNGVQKKVGARRGSDCCMAELCSGSGGGCAGQQ
jgi:hypothetical protein